ncbi:MAG: threonine--tRNA ligase [Candidatus Micrarchaeaceae archaeon]
MKALQLDVNSIAYKAMKPEASIYEEAKDNETHKFGNALVVMFTIEKGDKDDYANKLIDESIAFAKKQKINTLVLYPFAHLSSNLEALDKSMALYKHMKEYANNKFEGEVHAAPFGWNKELSLSIKGHPLAEQSKHYGAEIEASKADHKAVDLSIVKKSDWSALPPQDHRKIGEVLDLYSFQEVSPAMVYWHPNGYIIYKELVRFLRGIEERYDYQEISTPVLADIALWHVSGHIQHYRDSMFIFDSDFGSIGMKPMNCPSTMLIYKSRKWSYKELPFRTAIFDKVYRKELSGAVTGLFRVKELTQDDGHIFAREDQIQEEVSLLLKMVKEVYDTFGMTFVPNLSTMPDDHLGTEELWEKATLKLKKAIEENHLQYQIKEKEGAFYGPKIDCDVKDSMGRSWQLATIQLDYNLPQRFKLEYTNSAGEQEMPVVIHRAILGSIERFIGIMVEHYQGRFPTWISPVQVEVIPISEKHEEYARELYAKMKAAGIRVRLNDSDRTLEYKIRDAKSREVAYMAIVGAKEQASSTLSARDRLGNQASFKANEFILKVKQEAEERANGTFVVKGKEESSTL